MELTLLRISSGHDSTLSVLFARRPEGHRFLCFVIEDEYRTRKVMGETRIPTGRYQITLRKEGGFHNRYSARYPDIHRGMLWIRDIPNFEYVLIHVGNTDDDTAGCLLTGDTAEQNVPDEGWVGSSTAAYRRIYPPIARALEEGEEVWITVTNFDVP